MSGKRHIRQDDAHRAILTDFVPYEVPLRFSFTHIYDLLRKGVPAGGWIEKIFGQAVKDVDPYTYSVKGASGHRRDLGLIHPRLLREYAEFYTMFSGVILSLTAKSPWSLRRPSAVATTYFAVEDFLESGDDDGEDEGETEQEGKLARHPSSYFAYAPYNLLYKFYNSPELLHLEQRFALCLRVDVAKFFGNLYTHSISWATKTKPAAKRDRFAEKTFDAVFDRLMRRSTDGETHGILIGSEVARIFSEIILQDVDVRVLNRARRDGLTDGVDYTVRRYVDDYFIFCNDVRNGRIVEDLLERELKFYKLYVNESKKETLERPFVTALTLSRQRIGRCLDASLASRIPHTTGSILSGFALIRRLRLVVAEQKVKYSDCASFILKVIFRRTKDVLRADSYPAEHPVSCVRWLGAVIELGLFLFSADTRYQTAIAVGRLLSLIFECPRVTNPVRMELADLTIRRSIHVVDNIVAADADTGLEVSTFLTALRGVPRADEMPLTLLKRAAALWDETAEYFIFVPLIYFCGGHPHYATFTQKCVDAVLGRVLAAAPPDLLKCAELFCLGLDLLSCPYLSASEKQMIGRRFLLALGRKNPPLVDINKFVKETSSRTWFFDWRHRVRTQTYFHKKELSIAY